MIAFVHTHILIDILYIYLINFVKIKCNHVGNTKTVAGDAMLNIVWKTGRTCMHARRFVEDDHMRRRQGSLMSPTQQQLLNNSSHTYPTAGERLFPRDKRPMTPKVQ